ncbi:MAG TPA: hypothetical protein VEA69_13490, partial [Tepidisphaeraceae bacterium]|nr:hypothetical protein [Tepidisphaeraceae bacterium]
MPLRGVSLRAPRTSAPSRTDSTTPPPPHPLRIVSPSHPPPATIPATMPRRRPRWPRRLVLALALIAVLMTG